MNRYHEMNALYPIFLHQYDKGGKICAPIIFVRSFRYQDKMQ